MTIIHKFEPEKEKKKGIWKTRKFMAVAGIFLSGLIIAEIWVANTLANFGEKFEELNNLQKSLVQENLIYENEIATHSSLQNIASKSGILGLTKSKSVKYIR